MTTPRPGRLAAGTLLVLLAALAGPPADAAEESAGQLWIGEYHVGELAPPRPGLHRGPVYSIGGNRFQAEWRWDEASVRVHPHLVAADEKAPKEPKISAGPDLELLKPAHEYLSGRPWLIAEGLDPALKTKPGWDPVTQLERGTLDGNGLGSGGGSGSSVNPVLQAAGGGFLVPFRSPGPAFSRDLLISRDFSGSPIASK